MVIEGYAIIFNEVDRQNDVMLPSLEIIGDLPKMYLEHHSPEIGKWKSLIHDDVGVKVRGEVFDQFVCRSIRHGWRKGLSIGYRTLQSDYDRIIKRRTLSCIELYEISITTHPAVPKAQLSIVHPAWLASA